MKIEVEIPDQIVKFLKALTEFNDLDLQKYVRDAVEHCVLADVKDLEGPLWNPQTIIDKYELEQEEKSTT